MGYMFLLVHMRLVICSYCSYIKHIFQAPVGWLFVQEYCTNFYWMVEEYLHRNLKADYLKISYAISMYIEFKKPSLRFDMVKHFVFR